MNLHKLSPEAYQSKSEIATFSFSEHLPFLVTARKESTRGRARILMHPNSDSGLHEMFVLYGNSTFIRANKHIGKDESVYLLSGVCDVILFSESGAIEDVIRLESNSSTHPNFILLPSDKYHSVIIHSQEALLFESTPGPFDPSLTVFADWSPDETNFIGQEDFIKDVAKFRLLQKFQEDKRRTQTRVELESEKVYRLHGTKLINSKILDTLAAALKSGSLDRIRVCIHQNDESELQEMFMVFSKDTFVTPSYHSDKDESLFVVEGFATYIFFDKLGNIIHKVPLGSPTNSEGRASYCRIPKGVTHALVVESDIVIVKETTSGPFDKSQTFFPEWAHKSPSREDISRINLEYLGS
jgi:cupin fold WbuC family metalloprotein